jgi:hypothetical protein
MKKEIRRNEKENRKYNDCFFEHGNELSASIKC